MQHGPKEDKQIWVEIQEKPPPQLKPWALIVPWQKKLRLNHSTMDKSPREIVFETWKTNNKLWETLQKTQLILREADWKSWSSVINLHHALTPGLYGRRSKAHAGLTGFAGAKMSITWVWLMECYCGFKIVTYPGYKWSIWRSTWWNVDDLESTKHFCWKGSLIITFRCFDDMRKHFCWKGSLIITFRCFDDMRVFLLFWW